MRTSIEGQFVVEDHAAALGVFGRADRNLRCLEQAMQVEIFPHGHALGIRGDRAHVEKALRVLEDLLELYHTARHVSEQDVLTAIQLAQVGGSTTLNELVGDVVQVTARGKRISPKTLGQKRYIDAIRSNPIVFCIGPAGTGKTYLALAAAVAALKAKEVHRLILTRPAVEAGEKLGFLPGDLQDKVDPYLRPLYDALYDILGVEGFQKAMERNMIEVAPLAYMRGRTLEDAFIILDEAQNTTREQMKMFVTRMGLGSKMVITGDITQVDLPYGVRSGLADVQAILGDVSGIGFVHLRENDVVRHPLVQQMIRAYERDATRRTPGYPELPLSNGLPEPGVEQAAAMADDPAGDAPPWPAADARDGT